MRDDNQDKLFSAIRDKVHRLQGKGHHIVLLRVRLDPNSSRQTCRFETFEDDVLKEAFTERAVGENPVPNESQGALVNTSSRRVFQVHPSQAQGAQDPA